MPYYVGLGTAYDTGQSDHQTKISSTPGKAGPTVKISLLLDYSTKSETTYARTWSLIEVTICLIAWFLPKARTLSSSMAENHHYSKAFCATRLVYEGEEQADKVREYIEFREISGMRKEAQSLKPGHMFHSWRCFHDNGTFKMSGVKGSLPHQQCQIYKRDNWSWTCTNCAKKKLGEAYPTVHDVDGCLGAPT
jgi:hypothetical protein